MLDPSVIKAMVASGCSVETLAAVVIADATLEQEKLLESRAKARIIKQNQRSRPVDSGGQRRTEQDPPSSPLSPLDKEKVPTPLKEINSPLNPPSPPGFNINTPKSDDFEVFWKLYPRGEGRKAALKAYLKARKQGAANEEILAGVHRLLASGTEQRFCPHGSVWLNGERWNDEINVVQLSAKPQTVLERNLATLERVKSELSPIIPDNQSESCGQLVRGPNGTFSPSGSRFNPRAVTGNGVNIHPIPGEPPQGDLLANEWDGYQF